MRILATLVEEIVIVLVVLLVLPRFGINIPLPGFIGMIVGLAVWAVITYRLASRALEKKPVVVLSMVGSRGRVVSPLTPQGLIKIKDELWDAKSAGKIIDTDEEVIVVKQEGLKLIVRKITAKDSKEM
jgi:membrane-bound ClpP family serine protease